MAVPLSRKVVAQFGFLDNKEHMLTIAPSNGREGHMLKKSATMGFETKLVHGGENEDPFGAVNVPIYQSSTFRFKNAEQGAALFAGKEDG